jgi:hypothetical protein
MTRPQPFPSSPSYQAVIRALLRMHRFTLERQDESEEAESLRESMSGPWEGLSTVERERVTGLSRDLYEISDHPSQAPEPMNPQRKENSTRRMKRESEESGTGRSSSCDGGGSTCRHHSSRTFEAPFGVRPVMRQRQWFFSSTPPTLTLAMRISKPCC